MNERNKIGGWDDGPSPAEEFEDFESMMNAYPQTCNKVHQGEWVTGTAVAIGEEWVFVDIGTKSEAAIERSELTSDEGELEVSIGDSIKACVLEFDRHGGVRLSKRLQGQSNSWLLEEAQQSGIPVQGTVTELNKGGYSVDLMGTRAFCPLSQIDQQRTETPEDHLGATYEFRVLEYKEEGRNVVISRRALLEEQAKLVLQNLEVGSEITGQITSIRDFGAFVDLGGAEGMIHISELCHGRVSKPSDVVTVGETVKALVLEKDLERGRIALSIRALEADPWEKTDQLLTVGGRRMGTVARLETFGAFIELAPGLDGLLHISAISEGFGKPIRHPKDVLETGAQIEVMVDSIDCERKRLSLSLPLSADDQPDRVVDGQQEAGSKPLAVGDVVGVKVAKILASGVLVNLPNRQSGFIHASQTGVPRNKDLRRAFAIGDDVTAQIMEIDKAQNRIKLSITEMQHAHERNELEIYQGKGREGQGMGTFGDLFKKHLT